MVDPVKRHATWKKDGLAEEALRAIEIWANKSRGRVTRNGNILTLKFGSRLSYRLWGAWLAQGKKAIPFKVAVSARQSEDFVILDAQVASDEGFYLTRIAWTEKVLEERLEKALSDLQQL